MQSVMNCSARGDESLAERYELFHARRDAVKEQLKEMQETLDLLEFKCWYYQQAMADGTEENVRSAPLKKIPKQYQKIKEKMLYIDNNIT